MKKPKLRELGEALKVLFREGPYTSEFPRKLTVPPETFRGKPEFDKDVCIGCGACSEVCPSRSIEIIDDIEERTRTLKLHYDICNFCGQCHIHCTTKTGIDYTSDYDLAALNRDEMFVAVQKELAICERCGGVAGTMDQLRWIADRLGSLAYANPSLILTAMTDLDEDIEPAPRENGRRIDRDDIFRILCPSCRRAVFLTEEWG